MLRRFAAGAVVASIVIAVADIIIVSVPGLPQRNLSLLLTIWCVVPCVWGLWAMLAHPSWVPARLPLWGALLGFIAGFFAGLVLNLPYRVFGVSLPVSTLALTPLLGAVLYYLLWKLVGAMYRKFSETVAVA